MEKILITEDSYIEKYVRKNGSVGYRTINKDPSMANPDGKEESDINNILKNYNRTGHWPTSGKQGYYEEDIIPPDSLIAAHELIKNTEERFNALPSQIREQFNNDPTQLHYFLTNMSSKSDVDLAVKLGLIKQSPINDDPNDNKEAPSKKPKKPKDDEPKED